MFGIAVGKVWREVEGELSELPTERAQDEPIDELAARRAAKRNAI